MTFELQHILFLAISVTFLVAIFLNLTKKNSIAIALYSIQSIATAVLLIVFHPSDVSFLFLVALITTVAVKVVIAPLFFAWLVRKHRLTFSATSYLNVPLTLLVIAGLATLARSSFLSSLYMLNPVNHDMLLLAVAAILTSLFLSINRKGALTQMLGILSLENSIVSFAILAGLEQSPGLELGITFDILIWVMIATVFSSMVYRKFGSLDVTTMQKLTE